MSLSPRVWLAPNQLEPPGSGGPPSIACHAPELRRGLAEVPCRVVKVIAGPIAADGKTVFAVDPNDPRNILAQPIDGGTPSPLTQFTDKEITDFSLSPDRTQIAITRTSRVSDVVLIKGLK